jgi:hypothetical protein
MSEPDALAAQRRGLAERFATVAVAYSTDGKEVGFAGPIDLGIEVGGLAMVEAPDGGRLVVQVRELQIVEREGLSIDVDVSDVVPGAASATVQPRFRSIAGTAAVLGQIGASGFTALTATTPFGEQRWQPAGADEVATIVAALDRDESTVVVGTVADSTAPARLRSKGFARHTFMCGQSGSGKTYTTGVLFERLLAATELPILVLDPNSDHVHLAALADADGDSPEAKRYRDVASRVVVARARGLDGSHTLCADFSDLELDVQARLLRLDPIADLDDFAALRRLAAHLGESYSIGDLASAAAAGPTTAKLATRIDNLGLADWSLWRRAGETSITAVDLRDARGIVLDLGSLPRPEERSTVALAVLGRRWGNRARRQPVLLAVDEAHNVFPAVTDDRRPAATCRRRSRGAHRRRGPQVRAALVRRHATARQGAPKCRLSVRQPRADEDERCHRRRGADLTVLPCARRVDPPRPVVPPRPGAVRRADRPGSTARPDRRSPHAGRRRRRPDDVDDSRLTDPLYWRAIATRRRSSGSMKWSWSSEPTSSWTQLILPVNRLSCAV